MGIKHFTTYALLTGTLLTSTMAMGAAFQLKEQSASAQGNSFAGFTAHADDISIMWQNPAAMSMFEGSQVHVSQSLILPTSEVISQNASVTAGSDAVVEGRSDVGTDIGLDAVLPAFYFMHQVNDKTRMGISINTPFGLATDYEADSLARYEATTSKITTITVSPVISYKLTDHISIGGGPQFQYVDVRLGGAVDCSNLGDAALTSDCLVDNKGDDIDAGFVLGLHGHYDTFKWGIAYRSQVNHSLGGDVTVTNGAGVGAPAAAFYNTTISADFTSPETLSFGGAYDVSDKVTLLADAIWTNWTRFDEISIDYDQVGATPFAGSNNVTEETQYDDVWFLSAGATYYHDDQWTFRTGLAFDESPVSGNLRSARIADEDRWWFSLGASYKLNKDFAFDFGWSHLFIENADIDGTANAGNGTSTINYNAEHENVVDIFALSLNYTF